MHQAEEAVSRIKVGRGFVVLKRHLLSLKKFKIQQHVANSENSKNSKNSKNSPCSSIKEHPKL